MGFDSHSARILHTCSCYHDGCVSYTRLNKVYILFPNWAITVNGKYKTKERLDLDEIVQWLKARGDKFFYSNNTIFLDNFRQIVNKNVIFGTHQFFQTKNGQRVYSIMTLPETDNCNYNYDNKLILFAKGIPTMREVSRKIYCEIVVKGAWIELYRATLEKRYQPGGEGFNEALVDFQSATKNV